MEGDGVALVRVKPHLLGEVSCKVLSEFMGERLFSEAGARDGWINWNSRCPAKSAAFRGARRYLISGIHTTVSIVQFDSKNPLKFSQEKI